MGFPEVPQYHSCKFERLCFKGLPIGGGPRPQPAKVVDIPPLPAALRHPHRRVWGKQHGRAVLHDGVALHAEVEVRGRGGVHPDLGAFQHQGAFSEPCAAPLTIGCFASPEGQEDRGGSVAGLER